MLGSLLGLAVRAVTLPLDVLDVVIDPTQNTPITPLRDLRDAAAELLEEID